MEENSVVTLNLSEVCRLCLGGDFEMSEIFDEDSLKEEVTLAERIYKMGCVKICVDDGLPQMICLVCRTKINEAYEFRLQMLETDSLLRQCIYPDLIVEKTNDDETYCKSIDKSHFNNDFCSSEKEDDNADMKLLYVEEDGTQVFTLKDENMEYTVEVLPVNKDSDEKNVLKRNSDHDCDVVIINKKQKLNNNANKDTVVPLKIAKKLAKHGVLTQKFNVSTSSEDADKNDDERYLSGDHKEIIETLEDIRQADLNDSCEIKTVDASEIFSKKESVIPAIPKNASGAKENKKSAVKKKTSQDQSNGQQVNLSCQLCLKPFTDYELLRVHIITHFEGYNPYDPLSDDDADDPDSDKTHCKYCRLKLPNEQLPLHIMQEHKDETFVCTQCNGTFDSEQELKEHISKNHYMLQCNVCDQKFLAYLDLQSHLSVKHYNGQYWCQPCSKRFTQKHDFILHQRRHLGIKPFSCLHCNKRFVTSTLCKEHERRHELSKPYLCGFCGKGYVRQSELKYHEQTHTIDATSVSCEVCDKTFTSVSSYRLHKKRHELGCRCICRVCGKAYYTNAELKRHEQIHLGVRKYPCSLCGNSFLSQPELNRHLNYHRGEKKYLCKECGKAYYESGHLRIHERTHLGVKPFKCQICAKCFVARPKLMRHLKTHKNRVEQASDQKSAALVEEVTGIEKSNRDENVDKNVLANIVANYNGEEMKMENIVVDVAGNVIEMSESRLVEMANGNIIIMENGEAIETITNENGLLSMQNNIKIEIIDSVN